MLYYLANKDNDKFITFDSNQKACFTSDLHRAKLFTLDKAQNLVSNSLQKMNLKIYENEQEHKNMKDYIEDYAEQDYNENYIELNMKYDLNTIVDVLDNLPAKLENEKIKLTNQLIKLSRALTDIEHYKELKPKRSASAKCNLDTLETSILLKRREIKDSLFLIDCALDRIKGNNRDIKLENRNYVPRELNCLFLDNEIPKFEEWWEV